MVKVIHLDPGEKTVTRPLLFVVYKQETFVSRCSKVNFPPRIPLEGSKESKNPKGGEQVSVKTAPSGQGPFSEF